MTLFPLLESYDIKYLIVLGNQIMDEISREQIKLAIVEKLLRLNYPMPFLINKFKNTKKILKEAYAVVIIMKMKEDQYFIDDSVVDEILELVSLDDLVHYGAESPSLEFQERCKQKFWDIGREIEDKSELDRKSNFGKVRLRNIFKEKKKGDKNDKY